MIKAINKELAYIMLPLSFLLLAFQNANAQKKIDKSVIAYQYWVDSDITTLVTHSYDTPQQNIDIDATIDYSQLAAGFHKLYVRYKRTNHIWTIKDSTSFYVPSTPQPIVEKKYPIKGYRYGVNNKYSVKEIASVDKIPELNIEIPYSSINDYVGVDEYSFTFDSENDSVYAKKKANMAFFVQFHDTANQWGIPAGIDTLLTDSVGQKMHKMEVNRTLPVKRIGKGDFSVGKLTLSSDDSYCLASSTLCNVLIYKDDNIFMSLTPEEIEKREKFFLGKGSYFAIIYNQQKDGSIHLTNIDNWTADPTFSYADHKVSIASETANAQIHYTTDGSMPTSESPVYTEPITMTYNGVVKAIALCDGMADSFIKSFDVNDFETQTCAQPTISYDGRKIKLTTDVANANIYYTQDGSDPTTEDALMYNSEDGINVSGLGSIKAITTKDLMNNSAVATYEIPAFYDGKSQVEVEKAGNLSKAFEWNNGNVATDTLKVLGNINATDVASIKGMAGIKYLDLNKVNIEGNTLSDQAFANMNLKTVGLPASLTACGKDVFAGNKQLAAVTWNANSNMPAEVLSGIDNPNLLLYVNTKSYAPASVKNVVAGGIADNITLSEPTAEQASLGNFYAPTPFTAKKISYTRNFKQETEIGVCQGWETIALPFEAQTITHEANGKIAPFAKGDKDAKPFWLYELAPNGGFQATATLKANTPYIISMPNSQSYSDEYILGGNVTFSAENVQIDATQEASTKNNNREFITSFEQVDKALGIYALNVGTEYQGYQPGSIFAENFMDVRPFEAYLTTAEAAARFSTQFGGGTTGIENIPMKEVNGIKVWVSGSTLNIQSDKSRRIQVFNTMGMLVRNEHVEAGETLTITNLPSGIYIVNNKKVAVH